MSSAHKVINHGCNLVPIEKKNGDLMVLFLEYYFALGFKYHDSCKHLVTKYTILEFIVKKAVRGHEDEDSAFSKLENILAQSLIFHKSFLTNPNIWLSDAPFGAESPEDINEVETFYKKNFYSENRIIEMLSILTTRYLPLTNSEVELWKSSPLDFFIQQKNSGNDQEGSYLRVIY
jgi:hypothetical protein